MNGMFIALFLPYWGNCRAWMILSRDNLYPSTPPEERERRGEGDGDGEEEGEGEGEGESRSEVVVTTTYSLVLEYTRLTPPYTQPNIPPNNPCKTTY